MKKKISYLGISEAIQRAMEDIENIADPSLEDILETDKLAREAVYKYYKGV